VGFGDVVGFHGVIEQEYADYGKDCDQRTSFIEFFTYIEKYRIGQKGEEVCKEKSSETYF